MVLSASVNGLLMIRKKITPAQFNKVILSTEKKLKRIEQNRASLHLNRFTQAIVHLLLKTSLPKEKISGTEHIPEERASIYVLCTHPTAIDGHVLNRVVRKKSPLPMLGQTHFDNFVEIGLGYFLLRSPNTFPVFRTKASLPPQRQNTYFGKNELFGQISDDMLKKAESLNYRIITAIVYLLEENKINYLVSIGRLRNKDIGTFFNPTAVEILQKTSYEVPVIPVTFYCNKPKKVPFNARIRMTIHTPIYEHRKIKEKLIPYLNVP